MARRRRGLSARPRRQRGLEQPQAAAARRRRRARGRSTTSSPATTRRSTRRSPSCRGADAVGHRVVHGGERFRDRGARRRRRSSAALEALVDLAPLHQPAALAGIAAVGRALPDVPAVACFDTAFHATLPAAAATYALPRGVARALRAAALRLPRAVARVRGSRRAGGAARVVSCHLGAGASLAAVRDGRLRRHDDGLHAARGARDGHALGQRRPRARAVAAAPRAGRRRPRARPRPRGGLRASRATPTCAPSCARADAERAAGPRRLRPPPAGGDRRDGRGARRPRRARLHGRRRRARARDPRARRRGPRVPRRGARRRTRTPGATADAEIGAPGAAVRTLVVTAREDLEIARQVRELLARDS